MKTQEKKKSGARPPRDKPLVKSLILDRCLASFILDGTLDLSLDRLAGDVGVSKRMLVHYFGGREAIEHGALARLEERLRAQFSPEAFPVSATAEMVLGALWEQTTAPASKGVLLLVMDLSRRAWGGSKPARAFYREQQRLWAELLIKFIPDSALVEQVLQLFQGAVLAYLVTGDPKPGRRALARMVAEPETRTGTKKRRS
jgi:AcrR family transcriptional regulator